MIIMHRLVNLFTLLTFFFWGNTSLFQPEPQPAPADAWQPVVDGITYRQFFLDQPNQLYVARMERNNPGVILDTSLGQGRISGGLETVRAMAARYDQQVNYWGENWGNRNQVAVAINGFFYDPETGIPWSGQVLSGWYAKRFDERQSGSGLVWTFDRNIFIGGCVDHPAARQRVILGGHLEVGFDGINIPRGEKQVIIYTPHYGMSTFSDDKGVEILVRLQRPLLIMPQPAAIEGIVEQVQLDRGNTRIPFNHIVISASGEKAQLLSTIAPGTTVAISQEIRHYQPDCKTPGSQQWERVYAAIGGSYIFLRDGVLQGYKEDLGSVLRTPRSAVAYNDDYVFFIVIDGRDRFRSLGMSIVELGVFARSMLGATWGIAMDGGGSSTMVVNGEVVNQPITDVQEDGGTNTQAQMVERAVASGLMMIAVQPALRSSQFAPGEQVVAVPAAGLEIRQGPGDDYDVVTTLVVGSLGQIIDEGQLNGILARDNHWWRVDFGNVRGWVVESGLKAYP